MSNDIKALQRKVEGIEVLLHNLVSALTSNVATVADAKHAIDAYQKWIAEQEAADGVE